MGKIILFYNRETAKLNMDFYEKLLLHHRINFAHLGNACKNLPFSYSRSRVLCDYYLEIEALRERLEYFRKIYHSRYLK